jgi:hypothetical protein
MAIASKLASVRTPHRDLTETKTYKRLGYNPIGLDEGLRLTAAWLGEMGSFGRTGR